MELPGLRHDCLQIATASVSEHSVFSCTTSIGGIHQAAFNSATEAKQGPQTNSSYVQRPRRLDE